MLSKNGRRILLVDDDQEFSVMMQALLEREGYAASIAHGFEEAFDLTQSWNPHGIILDIVLRGAQDGLDLLAHLREHSSVPIIMLSGQDDETVKIRALSMGADDFVTKPFSPGELMARLQSLFRRIPNLDRLTFADLTLDLAAHRVHKSGIEIPLTKKEFQILACLAKKPGAVLSAEVILREAWGPQFVHYIQTLRVHIGNLRKKLGSTPWSSDYVRTVPGVGYGLEVKREQAV
ncbi:MAG TPA: response regulator transcription factor [Bryobacteraceae bacterium]|nr:response regulator transcription factor [Bryobacteraceae bacterium]